MPCGELVATNTAPLNTHRELNVNDDNPTATMSFTASGRLSRTVICALALVAGTLAACGIEAWRWSMQPQPPASAPVPEFAAPDIAKEANDYLRERNAEAISGPLQELLTDPTKKSVPTEKHAMLNQHAPAFALIGADGKRVESEDLLSRGPMVLVFYYGYSCDHCVAQLFGINKDLRYFTELKATVVGVSPDTPEHTRTQYVEYGAFNFPVLSDKDRSVASKYGVFRPAVGDISKWQAHGTFIIGRDRYVHWVNTGTEPFTDNFTLLRELAALEGRHPQKAPPAKGAVP